MSGWERCPPDIFLRSVAEEFALFMVFSQRIRGAITAASFHLLISALLAGCAAALVFMVWYPHPYGLLSGGVKLFVILVSVDVICGPALTLVLFNRQKRRRELMLDMSLVVVIQLAALIYGLHIVYQARPLFLVHEVDRFRVISIPDFLADDIEHELATLDPSMQPHWYKGPATVGIRSPKDSKERQGVLLDSAFGGRDYSQRPDFYIPYDDAYRPKVLARARPLKIFIARYPSTVDAANVQLDKSGLRLEHALFLPVLHKQEWIAILDQSANILGFLPGDGFISQ